MPYAKATIVSSFRMMAIACFLAALGVIIAGCGAAQSPDQATATAPPTPTMQSTGDAEDATKTASATAEPATLIPTPTQPAPTTPPQEGANAEREREWIATPNWMSREGEATRVPPSPLADDITNNWLMSFTHFDREYVNQAKSAFSFVEDGDLCSAADKFADLAALAQETDGND